MNAATMVDESNPRGSTGWQQWYEGTSHNRKFWIVSIAFHLKLTGASLPGGDEEFSWRENLPVTVSWCLGWISNERD